MEATATIELDGQYRALREGAGYLERAGRGQLSVRGADSVEYLQGQLTNDIEALEPGTGCYCALLDRKGHVQGDLRVLELAGDELWLDLEPEALPAVQRHLSMYKVGREVEIDDSSAERTIVSVLGPGAARATGSPPLGAEHSHAELTLGGVGCRAVVTDLGIDLVAAAADRDAILAALAGTDAVEVSEDAAEIVRVESGRPRFGRELSPQTLTQEAGINERAVSFTKGCYIGQETVARLHYKGKPNRHLRGLVLAGPAASGDPIAVGDREVGRVGTAVLSPALGHIALAIVRREAEPGVTVKVGEDNAAEVITLPFGSGASPEHSV